MNVRICYGDEDVWCRVHENPSINTRIRIHVYPDGSVEIEAPPGKSLEQIQLAAQRRARWVFDHRSAAQQARSLALPREYVSGETHFYLGRRYKLIIDAAPKQASSVKLIRGRILIQLPVADPVAVRRRLNDWYLARAEEYLGRKLSEWSEKLPWINQVPVLRLLPMNTQWGSCSPQGAIHLNPALVKAPPHCIDYVICHELCHLVEHNHSKRFYAMLDRHMPRWPHVKSELDGLAELILADQ